MYKELYPVTYYFYPLLQVPSEELTAQFYNVLQQECRIKSEALLYVHIPYCHDLCRFCPFHVRVNNDNEIYKKYTDILCKEIELIAEQPYIQSMSFGAVYFGGGSPSIFEVVDLKQIFRTLHENFNITPDAEISFEGEPQTLGDPERLDFLKEQKVSRISFGLQTYDETLRNHFNIRATLNHIDRCIQNARDRNFEEINADMMYNLPGQTVTALAEDIRRLAEDDLDSIDYYNLHYYAFPNKFKQQMQSGEIPSQPTSTMQLALGEEVRYQMRGLGYHYVADQIFSKDEAACKYFRILWGGGNGQHNAETVAIGASARGHINGMSYMNLGNTNRYLEQVGKGELPFEKFSGVLNTPENRGAVFMIKFFQLNKKYEQALASISGKLLNLWQEEGLIYETSEAWHVSEEGKRWTTNMMLDLFEPEQRFLAQGSLSTIVEKPGIRTGTF